MAGANARLPPKSQALGGDGAAASGSRARDGSTSLVYLARIRVRK
jgi:hypothetical protein